MKEQSLATKLFLERQDAREERKLALDEKRFALEEAMAARKLKFFKDGENLE